MNFVIFGVFLLRISYFLVWDGVV